MLDRLHFDNRFTAELPGDPERGNHRRQVQGACYARVTPTPVSAPRLVAYSLEAAALLDLTAEDCGSTDFLQVFAGNRLLPGMDPYATCYGGHQFGNWAGQLGDGRAINLGEVVNRRGDRYTLQLKGAGPTPFSRTADGLAVLRSSVREFLCSEAMFHLGIPTTRALSLVATGEAVVRDMFYDGNPRLEPGAIVCRLSRSFTRFGHFQLLAARNEIDLLRRLLDHTIGTDFPELGAPGEETYLRWFAEVCRRTAELVVGWMRVGFVHGVMNTDNMSVLGETIDYGPYGWLENFDPQWTPNTTDADGRRYCFGNQPRVAHWNLAQLGNALHPLIGRAEPLNEALDDYARHYGTAWRHMMAGKLGFETLASAEDDRLVNDLFELLGAVETDLTIFFRTLGDLPCAGIPDAAAEFAFFAEAFYAPAAVDADHKARFSTWLARYRARAAADPLPAPVRRARMTHSNPRYVLRNYLAQLAIDAAEQGDYAPIHTLLDVLRHPYADQPGRERYAEKRPDWARHRPGCSMLSCSS